MVLPLSLKTTGISPHHENCSIETTITPTLVKPMITSHCSPNFTGFHSHDTHVWNISPPRYTFFVGFPADLSSPSLSLAVPWSPWFLLLSSASSCWSASGLKHCFYSLRHLKYSLPDHIQFHTTYADDFHIDNSILSFSPKYTFTHQLLLPLSLESFLNIETRAILLCQSDQATALHRALQWLSIWFRVKARILEMAYKFLHSLNVSTIMPSILHWFCSYKLACLLFLEWVSHTPNLEFFLPFPQIFSWLTLTHPSHLCSDPTDPVRPSLPTLLILPAASSAMPPNPDFLFHACF